MAEEIWDTVDDYITGLLIGEDPVLDAALADSDAAGLPQISVTPAHGKLLYLLARIRGARSILEIGTLGGYSTIWLARALPADGRLISLEYSDKHAAVARANIERAGLADRVEVRVGTALDSLAELDRQDAGPFDLVFADADKANLPGYLTWSLRLTRPGGVIVVDNVVRDGRVVDADDPEPDIVGIRELGRMLAEEPRVSATMVQTVGGKGYDGFALILVND
jgi:predicted O-methyltransferase YrrM